MSGVDGTGAEEESEWRFDPEDFDEEGPVREYLEPGSPQLEHVIFVIFGVLFAIFIILRGIGLV